MRYCSQCRQTFPQPEGGAADSAPLSVCPVCGTALVERRILPPGTVVNGFSIVREIGHGGMGVVYLARQVNLERYVALKVLEDSLTGDQEFVDGFFREARSAASLSHPNIVQAYDAGIAEGGIYFFVMELIDGENLDRYIAEHGALDLFKGLEIASRISHALAYAWEHQHLCHGDIKPENIILKADGEVKLADLGLARDYHKDALCPGEAMATPAYAPPEIIRAESEKVSFRSDMYSFGATLYHLFAGVPPFPGDDPVQVCTMQLNNQPKPLIALRREIPSQLSILVDKLMEKSPKNRPESWDQVVKSIDSILETVKRARENEEKAILLEIRNRNQFRLKQTLIFALAALALILAALAFLLVSSGRRAADSPSGLFSRGMDPDGSREVAARLSRAEALAKWNSLKSTLPSMDTETAHQELKKYIDEHPFDAEAEAVEYRDVLRRKMDFENELRKFRDRLHAEEKECREGKLLRSSSENELKNAIAGIDSLFGQEFRTLTEQAPRFDVDPASIAEGLQPMFTQYRRQLETRLRQIRERQRIAREKQREAREKASREEQERKRIQKACEDDFHGLCEQVRTLRDKDSARKLSDSLEHWRKEYESVAPDDFKTRALLLRVILPDAFTSEYDLLHKFRNRLAGQEILNGYRFSDASEKGLLCQHRNESGILITGRIPWDLIREKTKKSAFCLIADSPELLRSLSSDQQIKLFKCLVPERHPMAFYQSFLERCPGISAVSKRELIRAAEVYLALFSGTSSGKEEEAEPQP